MPDSPVLIVGAGPTGLTLALTLQRHGIEARVIDKLERPADLSKALAVWPASLEVLASLGMHDAFSQSATPLRSVTFGDGAKRLARVDMGEGIDSAYPQPILLPQSKTEHILHEQYVASGGRVERGVELVSLDEDGDAVTVTLRDAHGHEETTRVAWLVGADGARSTVRHALGIEFEGYTEPALFLLGDVHIDGGDLDRHSIHIWWHNGGTVALFPFEHDVWRIIVEREGSPQTAGDDSSADTPATLEELQQAMDRHGPPGTRLSQPAWLSSFRTNERLAVRYRGARVFLAGDAAHIHTPAGGQGMNTGIQDAFNLGWKLAYVLQNRGDAQTLLDSYEAERRPVGIQVIDHASRLMHMGMSRSALVRFVRDLAVTVLDHMPALQMRLRTEMSETDITYRTGPLLALAGDSRHFARGLPGTRARDVHWTDAADGTARTLWPSLSPALHTLVTFGEADDIAARAAPHTDAVQIVRLPGTGEHAERYGFEAPGFVLIRPDQVVALRGSAQDGFILDRYLERVVRMGSAPAA
ncbi:monooxygenase FAD-binding protein [Caballeronia novacaledonica]|uniref:Monooxygenase FAD-binding protein n=1 Tax=Caballeronia novacaledonica TaxID=1544861 RepID=A0A2U3I2Q5_9BURK|nr:FAD-dependent monooxygenase [Caballeronia novacaledonica]SPB14424.1 monooxygenase FAD-binding protein [Caballeronia novacaledonica]